MAALTASWVVQPSSGTSPLTVTATVTASGGNPPYTYAYDWGDGSGAGTTASETHTYTTPGAYTVTCDVTDAGSSSVYDFSASSQLADFAVTLGSAAGTLVEVTGGELHMHTGATGASSANDKVSARWTKDGNTYAGMKAAFSYRLGASNQAPIEVYLSSDAAQSTYYQLQIQTGSYRVAKKAGGTFTSLSGTVAKTHNANTTYRGEFSVTATGDIELRLWNDGATRPTTPTWSASADPSRASIPAGYLILQALGGTSATALDAYFPDLTVTPL